jgi:serine/threonine protein phosphatase PrpC
VGPWTTQNKKNKNKKMQALAMEAFMRGSVDNISVLVIDLRNVDADAASAPQV